ncbi:MAG: glycosyltransferase family 2 protein [Bacteroidota bacterium]|nr:glycosyltransferase family 2 protein [Bacteroidota bacterium]MDP4218100.1 glycosyltransferase family 2 protein [Bacteroidota bacterium]MDP4246910.1 glycosyltransferase family 2 protein [Bacteroidota bacterium]MDP4254160.1 glycosyltransferase family 2 protein [Bacteroidota bacterium]MDP4260409.1 glycosyltransferase family 2 protein [Bacteroidota bacterium]
MLKDNPLISIVTLTWNTTSITCDFLRSINEHGTYKNIEVIVVDNGSKEDPTEVFKAIYPAVKVICNGKNLGFTGGNNVGIRAAKGDYLFIVNNDTEFTPGLLEGLLEIFEKYPDAGIVSPKFHYFFHKGTIEYAGYNTVNIFTGRNGMVGCRETDEGQYNEIKVTNYAHGGGMMVPRRIIDEVGPLPEQFFIYYEEFDWCEQIKRKGYKVYYQPKSLIYHKESMTTGKSSAFKTFYHTKNRIFFMRRNAPVPARLVFFTYFTLLTIPKNTLTFLFKGQKEHLRSFWKGILWQFNRSITFN